MGAIHPSIRLRGIEGAHPFASFRIQSS